MKIYLGSDPVKLIVNHSRCLMKLVTSVPVWTQLITSDDLLLCDIDGRSLVVEEA